MTPPPATRDGHAHAVTAEGQGGGTAQARRAGAALPLTAAELVRVAVVMPALDEADAVPVALDGAPAGVRVIVVDNGSTDATAEVAAALGCEVVTVPQRGYGRACRAGQEAAGRAPDPPHTPSGPRTQVGTCVPAPGGVCDSRPATRASAAEVVVTVDADATFDWGDLPALVRPVLRGEADLVIGRRVAARRELGSLPAHVAAANRVLGAATGALAGVPLHDLGPFRAGRREALAALEQRELTYGWTLEAVLRAGERGLAVREVDVACRRRAGRSKVTGRPWATMAATARMLALLARVALAGQARRRTLLLALLAVAGTVLYGVLGRGGAGALGSLAYWLMLGGGGLLLGLALPLTRTPTTHQRTGSTAGPAQDGGVSQESAPGRLARHTLDRPPGCVSQEPAPGRPARHTGPAAWVVVAGAIAMRAVLVPLAPATSTDAYRYLWDGRVQSAGISPYAYAPDAPELQGLRDTAVFPLINRPHVPTIYPPVAQAVFAGAHTAGLRTPTGWKALIAVADLAAVLLLMGLLRRSGRAPAQAVAYAWNPVPIIAFALAGHLDALVVVALLAAVVAWRRHRAALTGLALGLAGGLKLFPLLLLPAFTAVAASRRRTVLDHVPGHLAMAEVREAGPVPTRLRGLSPCSGTGDLPPSRDVTAGPVAGPPGRHAAARRRGRIGGTASFGALAAVAVGVLALSYVPHLLAGSDVLGFLSTEGYLREEGYVSGSRFVLLSAVGLHGTWWPLAVSALAAGAVALSRADAARRAAWLLGVALVLTTTLPWYAAPLIALAVAGRAGWVWTWFPLALYAAYLTRFHNVFEPWITRNDLTTLIRLVAAAGVAVLAALAVRPRWARRAVLGQPG